MKQLILTICLVAFNQLLNAQTDLYLKVKQLIAGSHPEIVTDNKLIAFNTWSVDDPESREANKSFEKAYKVYEYARLKGGLQGIVVVSFNKDNLSSMATITLDKDGVFKMISLRADVLSNLSDSTLHNKVFDSSGKEVYSNLPASKVFESVNQLITR